MQYKEVKLKNGSKKYYFRQPKRCYCSKDKTGTEQKLLPDGTICRWCGTITEKISEKEDVFEINVTGKRKGRYEDKEGKIKKCKIQNEKLFY